MTKKQHNIDQKKYYEDLRKKQLDHMKEVKQFRNDNWRPCLHDSCTQCHGTGIKKDGTSCVHMISCPCPKCSPKY